MQPSVVDSGVRLESLDAGAFWRVVLATPKANILDAAKIDALRQIFERARCEAALKGLLIDSEGPHFSFGASVEEHLPERCAAMLASLHAMAHSMLACNVVCVAAVRGQCLGGGLELVSLCQRVFVSHDAKLGQPEIALGVFAPIGSIALRERVRRPVAEDLLTSGRSMGGAEAVACGLADELSADPTEAAQAYLRTNFAAKSASSLRFAVRAARAELVGRYARELERLERMYLDELMPTADAVEGLRAFVERRAPVWRNA